MYTGWVKFAPIGSQGITPKGIQNGHYTDDAKLPQGGERLGSLPPGAITVQPCSPKSIYHLANKVRRAPFLGDVNTDGTVPRSD